MRIHGMRLLLEGSDTRQHGRAVCCHGMTSSVRLLSQVWTRRAEWRSALVKSSRAAQTSSPLPEAKKTTGLVAIQRLAAGAIFTATDHLLICYNKQQPSLLKIKEPTNDLTTIWRGTNRSNLLLFIRMMYKHRLNKRSGHLVLNSTQRAKPLIGKL
jgi:hypothetical protein